ncbi:MAG: aldo/keto reductase, partial [Defluviitaleaceae bacterium]|nr:aldo/keto reductase [Defluviitaleaceae bacterium]
MAQELIKLNTGAEIPLLGFGVFQLRDPEECVTAVKTAIEAGYTHIDTAAVYQNEQFVGQAIKETGINRKDLFITTKVWNTVQREAIKNPSAIESAFEESLKKLGTDYIDLYLVHWPVPNEAPGAEILAQKPFIDTWLALEKIYKSGAAKAIGVSNFHEHHLEEIKKVWSITPAVNQIEIQPYWNQKPLIKFGEDLGIIAEAWSPLGGNPGADGNKKSNVLEDSTINELA